MSTDVCIGHFFWYRPVTALSGLFVAQRVSLDRRYYGEAHAANNTPSRPHVLQQEFPKPLLDGELMRDSGSRL